MSVGALRAFDNAYQGVPTWDVGHPQGAVARLEARGLIHGPVLDVGCGTGEDALYVAACGHHVTGIDFAEAAVARAAAKARDRAVDPALATFLVLDALEVGTIGRTFDTVIDVGLFHCLQPWERECYAVALCDAVAVGGHGFVICWSDENPFGRGPGGISRRTIRSTFTRARGWRVITIEREALDTRLSEGQVRAWLALVERR